MAAKNHLFSRPDQTAWRTAMEGLVVVMLQVLHKAQPLGAHLRCMGLALFFLLYPCLVVKKKKANNPGPLKNDRTHMFGSSF